MRLQGEVRCILEIEPNMPLELNPRASLTTQNRAGDEGPRRGLGTAHAPIEVLIDQLHEEWRVSERRVTVAPFSKGCRRN
jgi:hypothetical protein